MKKSKRDFRVEAVAAMLGAVVILSNIRLASSAETAPTWAPTATKAHHSNGMQFIGKALDNEKVEIVVALSLRSADVLKARVAARSVLVTDSGSATVSAAEIAANHLPTEGQVSTVVSYLRKSGLSNIGAAPLPWTG